MKKKMKTISTAPKGITKIIAKPTSKRKLIPTWDRVDNNLASASKHMGYKRTKGQKRDIKGMRSQVVRGLAKLDLPHVDWRFTVVHNTLQSLNNQPGVKRVEYPLEFKKALMWMCKEGVPILKSIKEKEALLTGVEALPLDGFATLKNLPPGVFTGFDFMNSLEDGSVTTESTSSWSIATEDTILTEFGRVLDL